MRKKRKTAKNRFICGEQPTETGNREKSWPSEAAANRLKRGPAVSWSADCQTRLFTVGLVVKAAFPVEMAASINVTLIRSSWPSFVSVTVLLSMLQSPSPATEVNFCGHRLATRPPDAQFRRHLTRQNVVEQDRYYTIIIIIGIISYRNESSRSKCTEIIPPRMQCENTRGRLHRSSGPKIPLLGIRGRIVTQVIIRFKLVVYRKMCALVHVLFLLRLVIFSFYFFFLPFTRISHTYKLFVSDPHRSDVSDFVVLSVAFYRVPVTGTTTTTTYLPRLTYITVL